MGNNILNMEQSIIDHMTGFAPKGSKMVQLFNYDWEYEVTNMKIRYSIAEEPTKLEYCLIRLLHEKCMEEETFAKALGLDPNRTFDQKLLYNLINDKRGILKTNDTTIELNKYLKGDIEKMKVVNYYETEVEKYHDLESDLDKIKGLPDGIKEFEEVSKSEKREISIAMKIGIFTNEETDRQIAVVYDTEENEINQKLTDWLSDDKNKLILRQMSKSKL